MICAIVKPASNMFVTALTGGSRAAARRRAPPSSISVFHDVLEVADRLARAMKKETRSRASAFASRDGDERLHDPERACSGRSFRCFCTRPGMRSVHVRRSTMAMRQLPRLRPCACRSRRATRRSRRDRGRTATRRRVEPVELGARDEPFALVLFRLPQFGEVDLIAALQEPHARAGGTRAGGSAWPRSSPRPPSPRARAAATRRTASSTGVAPPSAASQAFSWPRAVASRLALLLRVAGDARGRRASATVSARRRGRVGSLLAAPLGEEGERFVTRRCMRGLADDRPVNGVVDPECVAAFEDAARAVGHVG